MVIAHTSLIAVALQQFQIVWRSLKRKKAQIQVDKLPLFFVLLPLAHGYLTENIMHMGKVGHDVIVLPGNPLC